MYKKISLFAMISLGLIGSTAEIFCMQNENYQEKDSSPKAVPLLSPNELLFKGIWQYNEELIVIAIRREACLDNPIATVDKKLYAKDDMPLNMALMATKKNGDDEMIPIIEFLLNVGAPINKEGAQGSLLYVALKSYLKVQKPSLSIIQLLLDHGADYSNQKISELLNPSGTDPLVSRVEDVFNIRKARVKDLLIQHSLKNSKKD